MARVPRSVFRLLLGAFFGGLMILLTPAAWPWEVRMLLGWAVFCAVNLLRLGQLLHLNSERTRQIATLEDETRALAATITTTAALVSLVGVMFILHLSSQAKGIEAYLLTALAILTVVFSWLLVQAEYTIHYARRFYADGGGVEFNQLNSDEPLADPAFLDFAYLAFSIGMTFQVSDTNVNTRAMRRLLLGHALVAYVFGAVIVAVTINALAGLLG